MTFKLRVLSTALAAILTAILSALLSVTLVYAQDLQLPTPFFGSQTLANEQSKGTNFASCAAGWYSFLSSTIGYQDGTDYWRDFILLPSHYVDVTNVENQLNKARYAVMARFMRCDLKQLDDAIKAYYKLEAELYFVRHYVTTEFGLAHVRILDAGERRIFHDEYMQYFPKDEALFSGYFDQFAGKYEQRGKGYASFSADPAYQQLGDKVDGLIESLKSFGKLGNEIGALGSDIGKDIAGAAGAVADAATSVWNSPGPSLTALAQSIANRFQICPDTTDPANCQGIGDIIAGNPDKIVQKLSASPQKKTFSEVMVTITQQQRTRAEYLSQGELYARYELLYGKVAGEGNSELLNRVTTLNTTIKDLAPLRQVETCARTVEQRECK